MPLSRYDKIFGDAAKVYRELVERYGKTKGRQVFYAMANKRRGRR